MSLPPSFNPNAGISRPPTYSSIASTSLPIVGPPAPPYPQQCITPQQLQPQFPPPVLLFFTSSTTSTTVPDIGPSSPSLTSGFSSRDDSSVPTYCFRSRYGISWLSANDSTARPASRVPSRHDILTTRGKRWCQRSR